MTQLRNSYNTSPLERPEALWMPCCCGQMAPYGLVSKTLHFSIIHALQGNGSEVMIARTLTLSLSPSVGHFHKLSHSPTLCHLHSHSFSIALFQSLVLSHALTLSSNRTHSRTHSLTPTSSFSHSHSLSLSLSLSFSHSRLLPFFHPHNV